MISPALVSLALNQWISPPPVLTADLTGKTVVVTGANAGLGFEAAKHFARMNPARLILVCRNEQKALNASTIIRNETGCDAEVQVMDASRFEDVVGLAKRLDGEPIDILVANLGVGLNEYHTTVDGWEEMLQVNHLSMALMALLLLPNLLRAAELRASTSRFVVNSSGMYVSHKFGEDALAQPSILAALNDEGHYPPDQMRLRYEASKLLNIFFVRAFAQHLSNPFAVVPVAATPPYCVSAFRRNLPLSVRFISRVMELLVGRTAEEGARQLVWGALGPDGRDGPHVRYAMSGSYASLATVQPASEYVVSQVGYETQERLWRETIDVLSKVAPSVRDIVGQHLSN